MEKQFFVYMLASRKDGVLYVGVTSDLRQRVLAAQAVVAVWL
ncbi:MAG: GIY-YIG nuclease family protein [Moraxellaceae bacterium]